MPPPRRSCEPRNSPRLLIAASIFREGSRPSGCPRPMRRGWLRRNRLNRTLPHFHRCGRVLCVCLGPISSVKPRSGGLGYLNALTARRAFQMLLPSRCAENGYGQQGINLRILTGNSLRILGGKSVTRYKRLRRHGRKHNSACFASRTYSSKLPSRNWKRYHLSFTMTFHCPEPTCKGHTLMCTDWEMGESYRQWRSDYGDDWEEKFRQRYETEIIQKYDTHFYVGTVASHPNRWIVIGLFYPPLQASSSQPCLF